MVRWLFGRWLVTSHLKQKNYLLFIKYKAQQLTNIQALIHQ